MNLKIPLLLFLFTSYSSYIFAQERQFTAINSDSTGVRFVNVVVDSKQINILTYEYFYNGGGVAIGDINNDGLPDLFFTANFGECKLFLNQGSLKFKDISKEAGIMDETSYHTGTSMVDINNDGWLDIYVCRALVYDTTLRANLLFINNKNGTFTNKAAAYGVADIGSATQAYFNDMDNDEDLDLIVVNHPLIGNKKLNLTYNKKGELEAVKDSFVYVESNKYLENINGKFFDRTKSAGLETTSFGLSAILEDFNNDGKIDIYQCNDYQQPDYLFINKGNGKFVNEFDKYFRHCSFNSMGSDYADINNDGLSDLFVLDMLPEGNHRQKQLKRGGNYDEFEKFVRFGLGYQYVKNVLQLNNGNNSYSDISYFTGTAFSDWSWAPLIADFDNNGFKDIYISNGDLRDLTDLDFMKFNSDSIKKALIKTKDANDVLKLLSIMPSVKVQKYFFKNFGGLNFKKINPKESGLEQFSTSYGAAYGDLDNDGDLDIVVNNSNDFPSIYRNNIIEKKEGNSVQIKLIGPPKNIHGIGTKIEAITPDGMKQTVIFNPFKGYLSSNDYKTLFGLGSNSSVTLIVSWPDGKQQEYNSVLAGTIQEFNYNMATLSKRNEPNAKMLFEDITSTTKLNYIYKENKYIDFKLEPLLPHRFSQLGPCMYVGDLNGDSLDDLLIGGAKDFSASLYFQKADGSFLLSKQPAFEKDKLFEDGAVTSFDIDSDGDNDLIITCGGNEYPNQESMYPLRFYKNDGKGNFIKASRQGNKFFTSSNSIAFSDYDKNGIIDLLISGRSVPGHYGRIPRSHLFSITKDSLKEIFFPAISKIGMVTASSWADINNDGWDDLVMVGEWMPITIFYNRNGKLDSVPTTIPNSNGWWNSLTIYDVNADGKKDIIAGNLGLNTRYKGTIEQPVSMVVSDFDENGSTDCIINTYVMNKSYPIAIRDNVLDQMPYLRKKFLRYSQYSDATIEDIFTPEQLSSADHLYANNMNSAIFLNSSDDNFIQKTLPVEAQLFPVNAILVEDINKDQIPDLLLVGNDYSSEVETGRNDAGIGLVLLGKGNAEYTVVPVTQSDFFIPGDVKCMSRITIEGNKAFIAGKNQGKIQVLRYNKTRF